MSRFVRFVRKMCAVGVLLTSPSWCLAHPAVDAAQVVLRKLSAPIYPEIALAARVQGDVELSLKVRKDGSVESVAMISGPPLLMRAAVSSAEQSQFECLNCVAEVTPYRLVYTYRIDEPRHSCTAPDDCGYSSPGHPTEVSRSANHVILTGHPARICVCEYARKVRSVKCLYVWKCGVRR